jgi:hypothetical protein
MRLRAGSRNRERNNVRYGSFIPLFCSAAQNGSGDKRLRGLINDATNNVAALRRS